MLSSDVSAAFDPNYPEVNERKNSAFCGRGFTFNKYTGARGKSGCNDANAEYIAYLRKVMDDAGVFFQTSELGKVDQGGGGTIAYILANLNMEVIDCGVPVLNMHAPWEVVSKIDVYGDMPRIRGIPSRREVNKITQILNTQKSPVEDFSSIRGFFYGYHVVGSPPPNS